MKSVASWKSVDAAIVPVFKLTSDEAKAAREILSSRQPEPKPEHSRRIRAKTKPEFEAEQFLLAL